ncbi:MAG: 7-cyano-7-deazaguanine synthase [Planctomycetota bacterium]
MSGGNEAIREMPGVNVDILEANQRGRRGWHKFVVGKHIKISPATLQAYCLAKWEPVAFDLLLLAAAVEIADRIQRRPSLGWGRDIRVRLPVHQVRRWKDRVITTRLVSVLELLTGDRWTIEFVGRQKVVSAPPQASLNMPRATSVVLPFSDGLDSRMAAALTAAKLGKELVRVRLGKKFGDWRGNSRDKLPFTAVPYQIKGFGKRLVETTARSRGFKFAIVSGLAAYLFKGSRVIVPESGQGALGPVLVPTGQAYEDYRNHPRFTAEVESFLFALLGHRINFEFPRLWYTKGETLKVFLNTPGGAVDWATTRSCWQQSRQVSVGGKRRQCGFCAACMLRRLSVHAAGLDEPADTYVCENLKSSSVELGLASGYSKFGKTQREYALAGTLHLDHLASLRSSPQHLRAVRRNARQLSKSLGIDSEEVAAKLDRLLMQHELEWKNFLSYLGPKSFVAKWTE